MVLARGRHVASSIHAQQYIALGSVHTTGNEQCEANMFLTDVPVGKLLKMSFPTVGGGGFAGLVFVICRSADESQLHLDFLQDWSSIHDLTRRYLAVIAPRPGGSVLLSRHVGGAGTEVRDMRFYGNEAKLLEPRWPTVQMACRYPAPHAIVAPTLVAGKEEHQEAFTILATELRDFFGISETLLPCAVVVSLHEERAVAVELTKHTTVYQLLKLTMVAIEPMSSQIRQKEAELNAATQEWHAERRLRPAEVLYREWNWHRAQLARELTQVAGQCDGEAADLCRWMGARLSQRSPLAADEDLRAARLLDLLYAGRFGTLPKRLRRTLSKMNDGYPEYHRDLTKIMHPPEETVIGAAERARVHEEEVRRLKSELDTLGGDIRLIDAVVTAAEGLGLERADSRVLLSWRLLEWPILALALPERSGPSLRLGRG
ncbi:hypothetical protein [Nonomuraea sp. B1E8]|uniref:hypothetical protein n=1 Tax=unclassified Nonomuraea TaxID=2593643 RepID=UPI00325E2749